MKFLKMIPNGDPNSEIGKKIYAAKEKEERRLAEKVEKSKNPDVDVRNFFTDDELKTLLYNNDNFKGSVADLSKMGRYKRVCAAAKWMDANSIEVVSIDIEPVSQDRPNAIVTMDIRRVASFTGKELQAFALLYTLSDSVFVSSVKEDVTRFTFGMEEIWK